jgi:hypothetical protein
MWRFRAAPERASAVAFEQLESVWPVCGSVLVWQGVAYAAAGRSSYLDGGIHLFGLEPATGKVQHKRTLRHVHAGVFDPPQNVDEWRSRNRQNWSDYKTRLAPDKSDSFAMEGALPDVMVAEGGSIFLRQLRFDGCLLPQQEKQQHLFSTSSLLDDREHHRSYWVLGSGDFRNVPVAFPWIVGNSLRVPFGLCLAFDETTVWSVHGGAGRKRQAADYQVVCSRRPDPLSAESAFPDFKERRSAAENKVKSNAVLWQTGLASRPRALLRAGEFLFVGGMQSADFRHALDDWQAGKISVLSSSTGELTTTIALTAPPVWDGLAAADGRLFIAMESGQLVCLE